MKKTMIAICDTDAEYACNFAEYLNSRKKLPFGAEVFTDVDKFCAYAEKNPPALLLLAEADRNAQVEKLKLETVVLLSENRQKKEQNINVIYKFQSAEAIIRELMEIYGKSSAAALTITAQKLEILGVYSPVGRCGKTLFALTIGQLLAERQPVLYLNLEHCSGFGALFYKEYSRNLSDVFYDLRCGKEEAVWRVEGMTESIGKLDYIPPAASPEDLACIRFSEWLQLLEYLQKASNYEIIILDLGSSVDQIFQLLKICKRVYIPVLEDKISRSKISEFYCLLEHWGKEEFRIREIRPPVPAPNAAEQGFPEALLWGKWGSYARRILEMDEEAYAES